MMGGGERLKEESADLFARSLEIAWREIGNASRKDDPVRPKTIRYRQGKSEKMERAELIDTKCNRVVVRTLRGWLMSVPLAEPREDATGNECNNKLSRNLHRSGIFYAEAAHQAILKTGNLGGNGYRYFRFRYATKGFDDKS
jgi:hypothetical protein